MARHITQAGRKVTTPAEVWVSVIACLCLGIAASALVVVADLPLWADVLLLVAALGGFALGVFNAGALLMTFVFDRLVSAAVSEAGPHFVIHLAIRPARGSKSMDIDDLDDLLEEIPQADQVSQQIVLRRGGVVRVTLSDKKAARVDAAAIAVRDRLLRQGYQVEVDLSA